MEIREFEKLVLELRPTLRRIAYKTRGSGYCDSDDFYQEALINLWQRLERGEFKDKTRSYVLKSCYFHLQNYSRTHRDNRLHISFDEPVSMSEDQPVSLKDVLADTTKDTRDDAHNRLLAQTILNNGLSKQEKEVAHLLYKGLTVREVACTLGISHVRVVKIKQHISQKYAALYHEAM